MTAPGMSPNPIGAAIERRDQIRLAIGFAIHSPVDTWLLCDGRTLRHTEYPELSESLRNIYGGDNGCFKLPYLINTVPGHTSYIKARKLQRPFPHEMQIGQIVSLPYTDDPPREKRIIDHYTR